MNYKHTFNIAVITFIISILWLIVSIYETLNPTVPANVQSKYLVPLEINTLDQDILKSLSEKSIRPQ